MLPLRLPAAAALLALAPTVVPPTAAPDPLPSLAEPSLSPDGGEIVFVSGGDVWSVPAAGGEARLLVSHPAHESRPLLSPDGARLAFVSTRSGNGDVYVVTLATGELTRLTFDDVLDQLDGWSRDGRWIYFSSTGRDIAGMNDVWRVPATGGTPAQVAADRYAAEYWSAAAPDGATLAITARGVVAGQWWRNGHSHLDESEIWLVRGVAPGGDGAPSYAPLVAGGAKHAWPMWAADGRTVYFMSDRGGRENLWAVDAAGGAPRALTRFDDGRVLWPSIAHDGRSIVFERDFGVWRYDVVAGEARPVPITLRGAAATAAVERQALTNGFQELAVAPDGRKLAFVVRGEVFAAATRDGGEATRVTRTAGAETHPAWAPDSRRLVYASARDGAHQLYLHDFATGRETRLTDGAGDALSPRFSPDGRRIAYLHAGREVRVLDVASGGSRAVATGAFALPPFADAGDVAWSPDGRWLAYLAPAGGRNFANLFVVAAEGGEPRQVSWLSNVFTGGVRWSPDGTYLLVTTAQRTEPAQVARVDLVPRTPRFREDQFRDLFEPGVPPRDVQPAPTAPRPVPAPAPGTPGDSAAPAADSAGRAAARRTEIDLDDVRRRLSFVNTGLSASDAVLSPDGTQLAIVASVAGQTSLYVWPMDDLARERVARQVTTTPGFKSAVQWSPDGKELYYLEGGRVSAVAVESRAARAVPATAELDVDFAVERTALLDQAWRYLRDNFYDERMHGVDWAAQRARIEPRVAAARTPDELRRLLAVMIGELNASHLGVNAPGGQSPYVGRLGIRWDRAALERDGTVRVAEVLPLGPADRPDGLRVGDVVTSVDGRPLAAGASLDDLLSHRAGRRTELGVRRAGGARTVAVQPVTTGTEKGLLYRAWVDDRRAYVERASGGRLGYVHLFDMGAGSLAQLHLDLDAEQHDREGVVVDVRNNNGGFVNAYALDVFARRPYLTMQSRGFAQVPARTQLGQRALERPTVLVTNQHSLSDAEDFTEGYRALGLGRVVGEPTSGWIIYTSNAQLLDGTTIRIPFQRIRDASGADMELKPRPVDVPVRRAVGEWYTGRDAQLDAAVRELLGTLPARRAAGER